MSNDKNQAVLYVEQIKAKKMDPRVLSVKERRKVVAYLQLDGQPPLDIAKFLGKCHQVIYRDMKILRNEYAFDVERGGSQSVIGRLLQAAAVAGSLALKSNDIDLYWKIEKDIFDRLQKAGYVPTVADKVIIKDERDVIAETTEDKVQIIDAIGRAVDRFRASESDQKRLPG